MLGYEQWADTGPTYPKLRLPHAVLVRDGLLVFLTILL